MCDRFRTESRHSLGSILVFVGSVVAMLKTFSTEEIECINCSRINVNILPT